MSCLNTHTVNRCLGKPPCGFAILAKGNSFSDFHFVFQEREIVLKMGIYSNENLLLGELISFTANNQRHQNVTYSRRRTISSGRVFEILL